MKQEGKKRPIVVEDHRHEWAALYTAEQDALARAIGYFPCVLDIQHVGSTSVPGLAAKPIIDIAVGVTSFEEAAVCIEPVQALGYRYRGENGIARRHYFCKDNPDAEPAYRRTHHIHMSETTSVDFQNQLAFRNALRGNPKLVRQYALLKRELAARFVDDIEAYCTAKTEFIMNTVGDYRALHPWTTQQ